MRYFATLPLVALSFAPTTAQACSSYRAPVDRVRAIFAAKPHFDAVVQVEVVDVAGTQNGGWRATSRLWEVVQGAVTETTLVFGQPEGVVSSCPALFSAARVGDAWILYLVRGGDAWTPNLFLPAGLVADAWVPGELHVLPAPAPVDGLKAVGPITPPR